MTATHYTSQVGPTGKPLVTSLAACNYTKPHPRWNMTNKREDVTCDRCKRIHGITK